MAGSRQGGEVVKANEAQESPDWMLKRAGCFTASRASALMAQGRGGQPSATRGRLLVTLALERVVGPLETYRNAAMERGQALEAEARDAYGFAQGVAVDEADFILHPSVPMCGCSPDGMLGDDGVLEIKCPDNPEKHLEAIRSGAHAKEYALQVQHQLWVTGRKWADVVSYDPRFPERLQLAVTRVERDEKTIAALADAVAVAEIEVAEVVAEINEQMECEA